MRVISPHADTGAAREMLLAEPGSTQVMVSPGSALQPAGDLIETDLTHESVDAVLVALCEAGIDRTGGSRSRRSTPRCPTPRTPPSRRSLATRSTRSSGTRS